MCSSDLVTLYLTNATDYKPYDSDLNGISQYGTGNFGLVNLGRGSYVDLIMFMWAEEYAPATPWGHVAILQLYHLSYYDFDDGWGTKDGVSSPRQRERMLIDSFQWFEITDDSEISVEIAQDRDGAAETSIAYWTFMHNDLGLLIRRYRMTPYKGAGMADLRSSLAGSGEDNPSDPNNLSTTPRNRAVSFTFSYDFLAFLTYEVLDMQNKPNKDGTSGRNFLFALSQPYGSECDVNPEIYYRQPSAGG